MCKIDEQALFLAELCESVIDKAALGSARFTPRDEKKDKKISNTKSIVINSPISAYRPGVKDALFLKLKALKAKPFFYVLFKKAYKKDFEDLGLEAYLAFEGKEFSDDFFRIALDDFALLCKEESDKMQQILTKVFITSLSFPSFGCCDKYMLCSKNKHCLHEDPVYATACQYRKNLENGKIFYS